MARLNVNPTRMELTNLKRKLVTARRGHKLLKDKRDELMRRFMDVVRENKALRRKVEENLRQASTLFAGAKGVLGDETVEASLLLPMRKMELTVGEKNVMSVLIPRFSAQDADDGEADNCPYGFAFTSTALDEALGYLSSVMGELLRLAEIEDEGSMLGADLKQAGGGFPGNGDLAVLDAPGIEGGLQGAVLGRAGAAGEKLHEHGSTPRKDRI